MIEWVLVAVLAVGAVIGWSIRNWSLLRGLSAQNRQRQLDQLHAPIEGQALAHQIDEVPADDYQVLAGRVEQLESENHDLTQTFLHKDREIDELYQLASLVKPLEFELQTTRAEVKRLRALAEQEGKNSGAVEANDPGMLHLQELEYQSDQLQDEPENSHPEDTTDNNLYHRDPDSNSASSFRETPDNNDTPDASSVRTLKSDITELELINTDLLQAHQSGEKQLLDIQSDLDEVRQQSDDYREKYSESVQLIDELKAKVRERDERIEKLDQDLLNTRNNHSVTLEAELSRSRAIGDEIEQSEEKLKLFDSTLARLTDLESEVSTNSNRSEELQESLEDYRTRNQVLKEELEISEERVGDLSAQLTGMKKSSQEQWQAFSVAQSEAQEATEQLDKLQQQLDLTRNENQKLTSSLQQVTLESEKLQEKNLANLQRSSAEINQTGKQLEDTQRALADSEKEILQLKAATTEMASALSGAKSQLSVNAEENQVLTAKNKHLDAELKASEDSRQQLQKDVEREQARLKTQVESRDTTIQELNGKLAEAQSYKPEVELLTRKNATYESQLQEKQSSIEKGRRTIEELNASLSKLTRQSNAAASQISQNDVDHRKMAMRGVVADSRLSVLPQLQVTLDANRSRLRDLENRDDELKALRQRYEAMDKNLVAKDVTIKELQTELSSMNTFAEEHSAIKQQLEKTKTALFEQQGSSERMRKQHTSLSENSENQRIALEKSNKNLAELQNHLRQKDETIKEQVIALEELSGLRESLQSFQEENSNLKLQANRIGVLEAEAKAHDNVIQQMQSEHEVELEAQRDLNNSGEKTIEELKQQLKQIDVLKTDLENLQTQLHAAQQQANRVTALQSTIRDKDQLVVKMNDEAEALREQNTLANQQLADATQSNDDLRRKVAKLPVLETSLQSIEVKLAQANDLLKAYDQTRKELAEKTTAVSVLQDRNKALDTEFRKLVPVAQEHHALTAKYNVLLEKSEQDASALSELQQQLQQHAEADQEKLVHLQKENQQYQSRIAAMEDNLRGTREELSAMDRVRSEYEATVNELEKARESAESVKYLKQQLDQESRQYHQLAAQIQKSDQQLEKVEEMQIKLSAAEDELKANRSRLVEFDALKQEINTLRASKEESDNQLGKLQEQLTEETVTLDSLKSNLAANADLQKTLSARESRINELEERLAAMTGQGGVAKAKPSSENSTAGDTNGRSKPLFRPSAEKDDLKKIYGIGPVMEKTLNSLGITSFKQIADFKRQDIKRVAEALDTFSDRIERDDWVGGAKKCYKKKHGSKA